MTTLPPPPPPPTAYAVPPPPPQPPQQQQSSGCLKWGLIGCGCLTVLCAAFVFVIVVVVFGAIKHSGPYEESLRQARSDSRVADALGRPIRASFVVGGTVNIDSGKGNADINYTLRGSKQNGKMHVVATRIDHAWSYSEMTVTPDEGAQIDLLH